MDKVAIGRPVLRGRWGVSLKVLLAGAVLVALLAGLYAWRTNANRPPWLAASHPVSEAELAQRWGIRITQIAATADGGMVDFRYQVIDPEKALQLVQEDDKGNLPDLPLLMAENSGMVVNSAAQMPSKHTLQAGIIYFLLYRNAAGAVKRGTPVTVVIGDQRIEHIVAR